MGKIPYCGKEFRKPQEYSRWPPERIQEVQTMVGAGMSKVQIASALGVGRGSVLMALARDRKHNRVKNGLTIDGDDRA